MAWMDLLVEVVAFFLCMVNQEPVCGGHKLSVVIKNSIGCLAGTIVRNDGNICVQDESVFPLLINFVLYIGRKGGGSIS